VAPAPEEDKQSDEDEQIPLADMGESSSKLDALLHILEGGLFLSRAHVRNKKQRPIHQDYCVFSIHKVPRYNSTSPFEEGFQLCEIGWDDEPPSA
jgi:hypothetical protein